MILRYDPDVVCLQEIDVGRRRSHGVDQAAEIAEALGMSYFFSPAIVREEERYGDATFSRLPLSLIGGRELPTPRGREPRAVLCTAVEWLGRSLRVLNTHCGLTVRERELQLQELVSLEWLTEQMTPTILCGDFNLTEYSRWYHRLCGMMRDTDHRASKTWPSSLPIRRIDFIFASHQVIPRYTFTPRNRLIRVASDHLPVISDVTISSDRTDELPHGAGRESGAA